MFNTVLFRKEKVGDSLLWSSIDSVWSSLFFSLRLVRVWPCSQRRPSTAPPCPSNDNILVITTRNWAKLSGGERETMFVSFCCRYCFFWKAREKIYFFLDWWPSRDFFVQPMQSSIVKTWNDGCTRFFMPIFMSERTTGISAVHWPAICPAWSKMRWKPSAILDINSSFKFYSAKNETRVFNWPVEPIGTPRAIDSPSRSTSIHVWSASRQRLQCSMINEVSGVDVRDTIFLFSFVFVLSRKRKFVGGVKVGEWFTATTELK